MSDSNKKINLSKQSGYTILETVVSVSIFLIIVTIGIGSVLSSKLTHQKSQDMRSILDNLSFVMEDMSKTIRGGNNFHCIYDGNTSSTNPLSCTGTNGKGISFYSSEGYRVVYTIGSNIQRSIAGGSFVAMTPPEIVIDSFTYITVSGAETADALQPFITIRLSGKIFYKNITTPFSLETSVSGRLIDA